MNNMEYFRGIKPVGKIDLDKLPSARFENKLPKPESFLPALKMSLERQADRLNSEHGQFLNAQGQMEMAGADSESDRLFVEMREKTWAQERGETREELQANREKNPSNITEIATTLLFDKILSEDFIIVRASSYDDYENGADQLVIDKETGAVICGVDDVIGNEGDDGAEKKEKKIAAKMAHGGAKIKYGVGVSEGGLKRKSLSHIPVFYFSLSKKELSGLLVSLTEGQGIARANEISVYTKLIESLAAQAARFSEDKSLHPQLRANLDHLKPSLEKMRTFVNSDLALAV